MRNQQPNGQCTDRWCGLTTTTMLGSPRGSNIEDFEFELRCEFMRCCHSKIDS
jgi:hypothetical protein